MKKKKLFEVSLINKAYSRIIYDTTRFYTSDTALELGFELKETEYDFESAEIVLLNIDDRSLVTRPVSKVSNDFVYEIDDDIVAHYGEWRGQIRFEKAGETYVSSPVKFRIENDLSNDRPPQLSDVQSWVSLKRYADSLTEELKQAVLEVEGMDDTFNANELERQDKFETAEHSRQTTFETNESERENGENVRVETFQTNETERQTTFKNAEQSRQTTFESNESERDETFNTNETIRQAQELEREKAETQRQIAFDNNEASRFETFNANEATRQENETTRQQAEQGRVSAESIRVENENQRNIDHANRSGELDSKANKKQEDWITVPVYNGAQQYAKSPLKVMKDEMGVVHFKGALTNIITGSASFSVPIGYRPDIGVTEGFIRIPVSLGSGQAVNTVQINYIGNAYITNSLDKQIAFFDGVSYVAERGL